MSEVGQLRMVVRSMTCFCGAAPLNGAHCRCVSLEPDLTAVPRQSLQGLHRRMFWSDADDKTVIPLTAFCRGPLPKVLLGRIKSACAFGSSRVLQQERFV